MENCQGRDLRADNLGAKKWGQLLGEELLGEPEPEGADTKTDGVDDDTDASEKDLAKDVWTTHSRY
jgi:hypothetical protein